MLPATTPVYGKGNSRDNETQVNKRLLPFEYPPQDDQNHDYREKQNRKERIKWDLKDIFSSDVLSPHFKNGQGGKPEKNQDSKNQTLGNIPKTSRIMRITPAHKQCTTIALDGVRKRGWI